MLTRIAVAGLVLLLLVVGARTGLAQDLPPALADRFSDGVDALKAGQLDRAEASFRYVLAHGGDRAFVHHNLGIVLQQRGRHEQALIEFHAALRLDPSFTPGRLLAGSSLLALGRLPEAITELRRAAAAMPKEPAVYLALANACERANDIAGLADAYRQLRALDPRNADYAYRLGKAYLKLAQWSFERLRAIDPSTARLSQALAQQYIEQDRLDLAQQALERAAQRNPTLDEIHLTLAAIYVRQGQLARARAEIDRELAIAPSSVAATELKAEIDRAAPPH